MSVRRGGLKMKDGRGAGRHFLRSAMSGTTATPRLVTEKYTDI
jgi:hypothetical protein